MMIRKFLAAAVLLFLSASAAFSQTTVVDSFQVDGAYRSYRLYIPASFTQSTRPLVLNMHGLGSNALEQQFYGNFMPIADTAGFYLVMPQGLSFAGTTFWNVGFPGTPPVDDVKFLSALIDTLARRYPVDKSRVYATGMSNGGYMSHLLGIRLNDKIAAIASVAGSIVSDIYASANPGRTVPAMQVHGTADQTVPYAGFAYGIHIDTVVKFWVKNNGCNATPVQTAVPNTNTSDGCTADRYVWSGGRNGATVELFKVTGGEHTWPGAAFNIGVTNQDFSASSEIWRFFRQYRLTQFTTAVGNQATTAQLLAVSPNPAKDRLQITAAGEGTTRISDITGKELLRTAQKDIDISALPTGVYMLEYSVGAEKATARFIKE